MKSSPLAAIILAAGKGTRMKSEKPKVLHEVFFEPMVHHVIKAIEPLSPERLLVIVGHEKEMVIDSLSAFTITAVEQEAQNGTGHAVLCAEDALTAFSGNVLIVCGDSPLLKTAHLKEMLAHHEQAQSVLTIMTTSLDPPTNYGRILSDSSGRVREIVEEKDATPTQRLIKEINAGIYCVAKSFLFEALKEVTTDNSQGEMYLTDIVSIAVSRGYDVMKYEHPLPDHVLGVNSRIELAKAHRELLIRRNEALMASGITMLCPETITIEPTAEVAPGCTLTSQITICGSTSIGHDTVIEPGASVRNSTIGSAVTIGANAVISDSTIPDKSVIAPLSHISGSSG